MSAVDAAAASQQQDALTGSSVAGDGQLWRKATDENTRRPYYFNLFSRNVVWEKPPELLVCEHRREIQQFSSALTSKAGREYKASTDFIASFKNLLMQTPRGRYQVDIGHKRIILHGKTLTHKIKLGNIMKLFLLPTDDCQRLFIVMLREPLRQGQELYPFVVMIFREEDEMEVELNIEQEEIDQKYSGQIAQDMEGAVYEILPRIFQALSGVKVFMPGRFKSALDWKCFRCAFRARDGMLYPLEASFFLVQKPPLYIQHNEIRHVEFKHLSHGGGDNRTFDLEITTKNPKMNGNCLTRKGDTSFVFSQIDGSELPLLFNFLTHTSIDILDAHVLDERDSAPESNSSNCDDLPMSPLPPQSSTATSTPHGGSVVDGGPEQQEQLRSSMSETSSSSRGKKCSIVPLQESISVPPASSERVSISSSGVDDVGSNYAGPRPNSTATPTLQGQSGVGAGQQQHQRSSVGESSSSSNGKKRKTVQAALRQSWQCVLCNIRSRALMCRGGCGTYKSSNAQIRRTALAFAGSLAEELIGVEVHSEAELMRYREQREHTRGNQHTVAERAPESNSSDQHGENADTNAKSHSSKSTDAESSRHNLQHWAIRRSVAAKSARNKKRKQRDNVKRAYEQFESADLARMRNREKLAKYEKANRPMLRHTRFCRTYNAVDGSCENGDECNMVHDDEDKYGKTTYFVHCINHCRTPWGCHPEETRQRKRSRYSRSGNNLPRGGCPRVHNRNARAGPCNIADV